MVIGLLNAPVCPVVSVKLKRYPELVRNIREAIEGYITALKEDGLPVPDEHFEALLLAV